MMEESITPMEYECPDYNKSSPTERVMGFFMKYIAESDSFQISADKKANQWDISARFLINGKESTSHIIMNPNVKDTEQLIEKITSQNPTLTFFNRAIILTGISTGMVIFSSAVGYIMSPIGTSISAGLLSLWLAFLIERVRLSRK